MPLFSNTKFWRSASHILPLRPQHKLGFREDVNWEITIHLKRQYGEKVKYYDHIISNDEYADSGTSEEISMSFDIAFDCISNLQDVGVIKTNKEKPLTSEQIKHNINKLKGKLAELVVILNGLTISELTWKIPLASQVISGDSLLVAQLSKKQKKKFMKPVEEMVPPTMPRGITEECVKFVTNFYATKYTKEGDNKLNEVALKILDTLKSVWCNPAFGPEFVETMNEGTYVNNVVVSAIHATLFDNPFGEHAFITTFERQSIASSDRRGDGRTGRRPDIMLVSKESDKLYELMYVECSRIFCNKQKEDDDNVKLWRETNDGMYWVQKSRKPEKGQFGIIGVQVAGQKLCLNILIRDKVEVHRYYKLRESIIPIRYSHEPSVLAEFIKTLLVLRNILIVNMSILRNTPLRRSSRNLEDSSTVTSD
ncbi:hypothetical protein RhiirA4_447785 [Rhizophagus irregularis]|uniref:Uncharacterized protein n=1 Tax=Rhizophagus irregularis TaxID=588596 RepID=A0A2I1H4S4_9GLOM|nr:hypothetical protein RhiirA4_447785 [Rhizophagus irregularis]